MRGSTVLYSSWSHGVKTRISCMVLCKGARHTGHHSTRVRVQNESSKHYQTFSNSKNTSAQDMPHGQNQREQLANR